MFITVIDGVFHCQTRELMDHRTRGEDSGEKKKSG